MCRSTDYTNFISGDRNRDCLKIRGFFVRLRAADPLPDSLTLLYLHRPESKAFVTLHRVGSARTAKGEVLFGSRDRVRVRDGSSFEVYLADQKALKGVFRKEGQNWNLECKCALESEIVGAECEVCVAADGDVALTERVEMAVKRKRTGFVALQTIPEEDPESNGCCCTCTEWRDVDVDDVDSTKTEVEMEIEQGVGWAVDVGLWVVCLGVGYVVSKSSAKTLRRLKIL